jgi:hypothetical protein
MTDGIPVHERIIRRIGIKIQRQRVGGIPVVRILAWICSNIKLVNLAAVLFMMDSFNPVAKYRQYGH